MPKVQTFISSKSIQPQGPGQRANPRIAQNAGLLRAGSVRAPKAHIAMLRNTLYDTLVDRVGRGQVTQALEGAAGEAYRTSLMIADKENRVAATEIQHKMSTEVRELLYERDDALFNKEGVDFLASADSAKEAATEIYKKGMESASPAIRNYLAGFVLTEQNRNLSNIAHSQKRNLDLAHDNIKVKAMSDMSAAMSFVTKPADLQQVIQAATSTILDVSSKDPAERKVTARAIYNQGMSSYVNMLTVSGSSPEQKIASNNKAMEYLAAWKSNPNHNAEAAAKAESMIAARLNQAFGQQGVEESRAAQLAALRSNKVLLSTTSAWLDAYDKGDQKAMTQVERGVRTMAGNNEFQDVGAFYTFQNNAKNNFGSYDPNVTSRIINLLPRVGDSGVMSEVMADIDQLPASMQISFMKSALDGRGAAVSTELKKATVVLTDFYMKGSREGHPSYKEGKQNIARAQGEVLLALQKSITTQDGEVMYPDMESTARKAIKKFLKGHPKNNNPPKVSKPFVEIITPSEYDRAITYFESGRYSAPEAQKQLHDNFNRSQRKIKGLKSMADREQASEAAITYYLWSKSRVEHIAHPGLDIDQLYGDLD